MDKRAALSIPRCRSANLSILRSSHFLIFRAFDSKPRPHVDGDIHSEPVWCPFGVHLESITLTQSLFISLSVHPFTFIYARLAICWRPAVSGQWRWHPLKGHSVCFCRQSLCFLLSADVRGIECSEPLCLSLLFCVDDVLFNAARSPPFLRLLFQSVRFDLLCDCH